MSTHSDREAWIRIRREDEIPPDAPNNYNFGFRAAMGRLQATHPPIGRAFSALYRQIMFEPGELSRQEQEMVAAVTAAGPPQECVAHLQDLAREGAQAITLQITGWDQKGQYTSAWSTRCSLTSTGNGLPQLMG